MTAGTVTASAWTQARAAQTKAEVAVREIRSRADFLAIHELFDTIWRPIESKPLVTPEWLRALSKAGNFVAGAFDGHHLVAACAAFFGAPTERSLHSHIAGVDPRARGRDIGFALKVFQRAWALDRGVATIAWTFDPLVRRNAHFNLTKLAATPVEYLPDFYGNMTDGINDTDESDRLLVHWRLHETEVAAACGGLPRAAPATHGYATLLEAGPASAPTSRPARSGRVLVATPPDIEALRRQDPHVARAWRTALREALGGALDDGGSVRGFDDGGRYVIDLGRGSR